MTKLFDNMAANSGEKTTSSDCGSFNGIVNHLRNEGWARFHVHDLPMLQRLDWKFVNFADQLVRGLPADPYDPTGRRKRRYGVFVWIPGARMLVPVSRSFDEFGDAIVPYLQSVDFQSEFGGEVRWLPGLSEASLRSRQLAELIEMDGTIALDAGTLKVAESYFVGVHVIALEPEGTALAVITPDELHRDGEPVTFVHLLERVNVTGGENSVADVASVGAKPDDLEPSRLKAQFTLRDPGDGFVVDDRKVSHYVSGVGLADASKPGRRCAILVDFTPARRSLSNED